MASEVERDGFDGAMSSSAAPALRIWPPFWSGVEANDSWTARILAFAVPVFSIIIAAMIGYFCFHWMFPYREAVNRNAVPALKKD